MEIVTVKVGILRAEKINKFIILVNYIVRTQMAMISSNDKRPEYYSVSNTSKWLIVLDRIDEKLGPKLSSTSRNE